MLKRLAVCGMLLTGGIAFAGDAPVAPAAPKPFFQGDFFGEMARSFGVVQKVDVEGQTLTVKLDHQGKIVTVPIVADTELHVRDSWGELSDYFPGQHVMLFMYVDEEKNWTYPRAVQDDIHMRSGHKHYAKVTAIDAATRGIKTEREEKNNKGEVTKTVKDEYVCAPTVKVWKGAEAGAFESLAVGDVVIVQLVEREGKLEAAELLTFEGDATVRNVQEAKHRADMDKLGLVTYVNDFEVLNGSLTISAAWSCSNRAKDLKVGEIVCLTPNDGKGAVGKSFAGQVLSVKGVDSRQRIEMLINSRVAAHLVRGQTLRLFMPGTGPEIPTGKYGVPVAK